MTFFETSERFGLRCLFHYLLVGGFFPNFEVLLQWFMQVVGSNGFSNMGITQFCFCFHWWSRTPTKDVLVKKSAPLFYYTIFSLSQYSLIVGGQSVVCSLMAVLLHCSLLPTPQHWGPFLLLITSTLLFVLKLPTSHNEKKRDWQLKTMSLKHWLSSWMIHVVLL